MSKNYMYMITQVRGPVQHKYTYAADYLSKFKTNIRHIVLNISFFQHFILVFQGNKTRYQRQNYQYEDVPSGCEYHVILFVSRLVCGPNLNAFCLSLFSVTLLSKRFSI